MSQPAIFPVTLQIPSCRPQPVQKKPDMVAYKELRKVEREGMIGHIPGISPGFKVNGKGELAILGIHCNICAGIYCKQASLT